MDASAERNFGLTETEFTTLLAALKDGDDRLFERVYLAQFKYCMEKLMSFDKLSEQHAYDATMDAVLKMRDLLLEGKVHYGNLRHLFVKIDRQLYYRKAGRELPTELQDVQDIPLMQAIEEDEVVLLEPLYRKMEAAFKQLGDSCRELLKRHFYDRQQLKEIATADGTNYATLRQQKGRCIKRLQKLANIIPEQNQF